LGPVAALCALPDGRLASGSSGGPDNNTILLWDLNTGAKTETARLEGHSAVTALTALCALPGV
jgi:WD40 repeat protein